MKIHIRKAQGGKQVSVHARRELAGRVFQSAAQVPADREAVKTAVHGVHTDTERMAAQALGLRVAQVNPGGEA